MWVFLAPGSGYVVAGFLGSRGGHAAVSYLFVWKTHAVFFDGNVFSLDITCVCSSLVGLMLRFLNACV